MEENIGSEVQMILRRQLWSIVGDLNASLNLGLD
jgi:hypothetical protein